MEIDIKIHLTDEEVVQYIESNVFLSEFFINIDLYDVIANKNTNKYPYQYSNMRRFVSSHINQDLKDIILNTHIVPTS